MQNKELAKWHNKWEYLNSTVNRRFIGKENVVKMCLAAIFAKGHILLNDVPGTGKTYLSTIISESISDMHFKRIQFTADLLPSDIVGVQIFDPLTRKWEFHQGPIFANLVLADEINRASAKAQSALLEAMQEQTVTIDGIKNPLPCPFVVLASQNPIEQFGTYNLPEAQLDRFMISITVGYLDEISAFNLVTNANNFVKDLQNEKESSKLNELLSINDIIKMQNAVEDVFIDKKVGKLIVEIINTTRAKKFVKVGVSTRGMLALTKFVKVLALTNHRDFVTPEDVFDSVVPVLSHRLVMDSNASFENITAENIINEITAQVCE